MIADIVLTGVYWLVYAATLPLQSVSDVSLPSEISSAISTAGGFLGAVDAFLPVVTILAVLAAILVVDGAIIAYKIIMWLVRRLPTQS